MTRRRLALPALFVALVLVGSRVAAQCSMCQSVISQSPEAQAAAAQLNLAILVMFSAPYLLLASFVLLVFPEPIKHFLLRAVGRPPSR
jgi:hypothetical protein